MIIFESVPATCSSPSNLRLLSLILILSITLICDAQIYDGQNPAQDYDYLVTKKPRQTKKPEYHSPDLEEFLDSARVAKEVPLDYVRGIVIMPPLLLTPPQQRLRGMSLTRKERMDKRLSYYDPLGRLQRSHHPTIEEMVPFENDPDVPDSYIMFADDPLLLVQPYPTLKPISSGATEAGSGALPMNDEEVGDAEPDAGTAPPEPGTTSEDINTSTLESPTTSEDTNNSTLPET